MRKIAIFVEGQTELILVREFLLRKYNYEVNLKCLELFREGNLRHIEYEYSNPNATSFYQIVKVGNDQKVTSIIIERESSLFSQGFEKVIGLRDMYSRIYREAAGDGKIHLELNQKFITATNSTIKELSKNPENIFICFSIMEVEAWFIAFYAIFEKLHTDLTINLIKEKLGIDLENVNPETDFFHPASILSDIFNIGGLSYDKHKGDVELICNHLSNDNFEALYISSICDSFKYFYEKVA